MADRLDDAPGNDDLTDAQLSAADEAAEAEVEEAGAGGDTLDESESIDDELDEEELDEEELDEDVEDEDDDAEAAAGRATRLGARARAAETARARANRATKGPRAATRTAFAIDPATRIKDPASQIFVAVSVGFFVLVFLYAMAFGRGGAFTVVPTPTPVVTPSPGPSTTPGASGATTAPTVAPTEVPTTAPTTAPTTGAS